MTSQIKLPFFPLLMLISFASVNAVLFTPALPEITRFFQITDDAAQYTITWFLIGYALGQLLYGPLANRFGRKPALYMGISIQIVSSLLCVLAGLVHQFPLLIIARFILALGSGVGLKMTFTLVNECYSPHVASQKLSLIMLAFAIAPGLGVALGGFLTGTFGWMSCFYAGAVYGVILLLMTRRLPETQKTPDYNALKWNHLLEGYGSQFKNLQLVAAGLLMGGTTSFIYVFATLGPFIAINLFALSSEQYGVANILPPIGLIFGSLTSAHLVKKQVRLDSIIRAGIAITGLGTIVIMTTMLAHLPVIFSLFIPLIIIYFGIALIMANASSIAMSQVKDKAHGSAVMSFINMGLATILVLSLGFFPVSLLLLSMVYLVLCVGIIGLYPFVVGGYDKRG